MKQKNKFETLSMIKFDQSPRYRKEKRHLVLNMDFVQGSYLGILRGIFDQGPSWTDTIKKELLDPESTGVTGEKVDVTITNKQIIIAPELVENPEELAIEIDRQTLLDLLKQWEELTAQNYQRITFTRHEDGSITLTGE